MTERRNDARVVLSGLGDLDLGATLLGGQAFRWRRAGEGAAGGRLRGWIGDRPVSVEPAPDGLAIIALDGRREGLGEAAARYFDAGRDYGAIERRLLRDPRLRCVARGVRILRQPAFETLISFVVSANNNIPRIAKCVELLCGLAGREVLPGARAFPEPAALAALDAETLRREANLGYRDRYAAETSRLVASGAVDLDALDLVRTPELRAALAALPGVGPKVADCVALFAYGRLEVFPVDTWVRRAYSALYLAGAPAADREISELARRRFGRYAGVAQQYLFEGVRLEADRRRQKAEGTGQ